MDVLSENNNNKLEEYKMLREEIMHYMEKDTTLFTCLFSSVTAVLFFAIEWDVPECVLLAYLIIIPISGKFAYHQKQMAKISAYMQKQLEPATGIKWEMFIDKVSNDSNRPRTARFLKFSESALMAFASAAVYAYMSYNDNLPCSRPRLFWAELTVLMILFVWSLLISREIYDIRKCRKAYLDIIDTIQL